MKLENKEYITVRINFKKFDNMRFVGHLDLMKYFQRAFRRIDLPMQYSYGFNKRHQMSFAAPLPLGMMGYSEYMDIELNIDGCNNFLSKKNTSKDLTEIIVDELNNQMCHGIKIIRACIVNNNFDNLANLANMAKYIILFNTGTDIKDDIITYINQLNSNTEYILNFKKKIKSKNKKKIKKIIDTDNPFVYNEDEKEDSIYINIPVNIKPLLYSINFTQYLLDNTMYQAIEMLSSYGNNGSLKPDIIYDDFINKTGLNLECIYIRLALYKDNKDLMEV